MAENMLNMNILSPMPVQISDLANTKGRELYF